MTARFTLRLAAAIVAASWGAAARAQTVHTDPGTSYNATALTGFATTGSDMGGMKVTAFFTDGTESTQFWGDLGAGTWGVSDVAYSVLLSGAGDTYSEPWRLLDHTGLGISRLVLSGAPGRTVFDIIPDPWLTVGSAQGAPMLVVGGDVFGTTATYRNRVGVGGAAPLGDLWEMLDITFLKPIGANGMLFTTDTDNIGGRGTITATPEPATFGLIALGALAIVGADWRRRRASA
jgi:hypothetical protein